MTQTTETLPAQADLKPADAAWSCRFCGSGSGVAVLDAGSQPASDLFPAPTDPEPDPEHPLVMVMCTDCHLVQLESDPTTPEEPRGVEPAALIAQAEAAVDQADSEGYIRPGTRVFEYPSPHGGSWVEQLARRDMVEVTEGKAELLVDIFGMMHDADQRAALEERISHMSDDGVLLMQYHTVAAIVRSGIWNALRHGHFAYYSTPVLVEMGRQLGLTAIGVWEYSLYGGTLLLAFAKDGSRWGGQGADVTAMIEREVARGDSRPGVRRIAGRGAVEFGVGDRGLPGANHGPECVGRQGTAPRRGRQRCCAARISRRIRSSRWPMPPPASMAAPCRATGFRSCHRPIWWSCVRSVCCCSSLTCCRRCARRLPAIESNGGRWVVLDPMPREVEPVASTRRSDGFGTCVTAAAPGRLTTPVSPS